VNCVRPLNVPRSLTATQAGCESAVNERSQYKRGVVNETPHAGLGLDQRIAGARNKLYRQLADAYVLTIEDGTGPQHPDAMPSIR
jgi:hypothetical protein